MPRHNSPPRRTQKTTRFSATLVLIITIALLFIGLGTLILISDVNSQKTEILLTDGDKNMILVFDPDVEGIRSVDLPGSTQVELANNLGKLDLGNVWEVGKNEGKSGEVLVKTIVKNFTMPVYMWAKVRDTEAISSVSGKLEFVFAPEATNISFIDRVCLAWKLLTSGDSDKIDLESWGAIRKANLIDGRSGYVLGDTLSGKLLLTFAEKEAENKGLKAKIVYPAGGIDVANSVSSILATMGIKVAQMEQGESDNCEVSGNNSKLKGKIAKVLGDCVVGDKKQGNFDIVVKLSGQFVALF